jgi:methionyl-tRNA formyltransferase
VHPSLLPRWRGAAPVERALMAGDAETGVTIHLTTSELDAGPIAAQDSFAIDSEDDAGAIFERAAPLAAQLLAGPLEQDPSSIQFEEQPAEGASYAEKIAPADRELDWSRPPADLVNQVRALSPHIGAWGLVEGQRLIVWRARLTSADAPLRVGDVELLEVQPEGRRRMSADEYVRGRR